MPTLSEIEHVLRIADQESCFAYLCPNDFSYPEGPFPHVLALGGKRALQGSGVADWEKLQAFVEGSSSAVFGVLGYQMLHQAEELSANPNQQYHCPPLFFFEPEKILSPEDFSSLGAINITEYREKGKRSWKANSQKEDYLRTVETLKRHIERGDLYETNFCISFSGEGLLDPVSVFIELMKESPMPFSGLLKYQDFYVLCASPERYLKKEGRRLVSQPIKGTLAQHDNPEKLFTDKEQSENIMIVDLVRNDLSKVCVGGSVRVKELCGIYKFPGVYQMISTVVGEMEEPDRWMEALRATFPMGSMTGAPKYKAMQLIEKYETHSRQLFSGAFGLIHPDGNFDFNVIIRSLFYFPSKQNFFFSAGSAITALCEPEQEYEECMLKTQAIQRVLGKL